MYCVPAALSSAKCQGRSNNRPQYCRPTRRSVYPTRVPFRDKVDWHYTRLMGFGALASLFPAALRFRRTRAGRYPPTQSPAQLAGSAVPDQQVSDLGVQITRRNQNVQSSIVAICSW